MNKEEQKNTESDAENNFFSRLTFLDQTLKKDECWDLSFKDGPEQYRAYYLKRGGRDFFEKKE